MCLLFKILRVYLTLITNFFLVLLTLAVNIFAIGKLASGILPQDNFGVFFFNMQSTLGSVQI